MIFTIVSNCKSVEYGYSYPMLFEYNVDNRLLERCLQFRDPEVLLDDNLTFAELIR